MELSEEEKKAIETLEIEGTESNYLEVRILLNLVDKQQEEIEEKTTIIMAGAEKVKQLEKEIEDFKGKYKDLFFQNFELWEKNIFPMKAIREDYISKDKIREKIDQIESFDKAMHQKNGQFTILVLQGLLKEDDGDHIPRID